MAEHPRPGYREHNGIADWQECDTCHIRLGAHEQTLYDETYYAADWDPENCPVPGCEGLMCLPEDEA
jgi:hypothetical protein